MHHMAGSPSSTNTAAWSQRIQDAAVDLQSGSAVRAESLAQDVAQALLDEIAARPLLSALRNLTASAEDAAWEDLVPLYLLSKLGRIASAEAQEVFAALLQHAAGSCAPRELALTLVSDWAETSPAQCVSCCWHAQ